MKKRLSTNAWPVFFNQFGLVAEEAAAAEEKITIPSELCSVVKPKKGLQSPWIVCFGQTDLMF